MKSFVTIVGNGLGEIAPSFIISVGKSRFLFNLPENIERIANERKLKISKIDHYFLTSSHFNYCCEYPVLISNVFDPVHTKIPIHASTEAINALFNFGIKTTISKDDLVKFKRISSDETIVNCHDTIFCPFKITQNDIDVLCYYIKLEDEVGKLDANKAKGLNLEGKQIGEIMKKGSCKANGIIINRDDICGERRITGNMLVLHLPTIDHCREAINKLKTMEIKEIKGIVTISCDAVINSIEYTSYFNEFDCPNVLLRDILFDNKLELKQTCFRKTETFMDQMRDILPNYVPSPKNYSLKTLINYSDDLFEYTLTPSFRKTQLPESIPVKLPSLPPLIDNSTEKCIVKILGSGGAFPTSTRDSSSSLVMIENKIILIDCGMNVSNRIVREGIDLNDIDLIYITHSHSDHTLGLFNILLHRTKPITIIGPIEFETGMRSILERYHCLLSIQYIPNSAFCEGTNHSEAIKLMKEFPFHVVTKELKHTIPNFAIKFIYDSFKIVFSGDTSPCVEEVGFYENVDIVVHDCNYEIGKEDIALKFGHSTPSLIIDTLGSCGIKAIILNHIQPRAAPMCVIEHQKTAFEFIDCFDGFTFTPSILNHLDEYISLYKQISDSLV